MRSLLVSVFLVPAALLTAGTVDTAIVPFTLGGTFNGTFAQFDPTLGTLTGVTLFYQNVNLAMSVHADHPNAGGQVSTYADFLSGAYMTLPDVPLVNPLVVMTTTHFGCIDGSKEFNSCTVDGNFSSGPLAGSMALSPSPDFSSYIGNSTLAFGLGSLADITNIITTPSISNPVGNNLYFNGATTAGNVYLEYTYTAAVPEPASFALFGVGVGLLALYRNAFQKRKAAPARKPSKA